MKINYFLFIVLLNLIRSHKAFDRFARDLKEIDIDPRNNLSSDQIKLDSTVGSINQISSNQTLTNQTVHSSNITLVNEQASNQNASLIHNSETTNKIQWFKAKPLDYDENDDLNSTNSTLPSFENEQNDTAQHQSLFEIDSEQYLIDGYQSVNDSNQLFFNRRIR